MRFFISLFLAAAVALPLAAAADPVSSHLGTASWIVGSYHCMNSSTLQGKAQKPMASTFDITRDGNWFDLKNPKYPSSLTRLTYDSAKRKYVGISTDTDGSYAVSNLDITSNTLMLNTPSVLSSTPDNINVKFLVRRTSSGYVYTESGTYSTGKNKGKAYTYKGVCTR